VQEPAELPAWRPAAALTGRHGECAVLDRLVEAVRAGESQALVAPSCTSISGDLPSSHHQRTAQQPPAPGTLVSGRTEKGL